MKNTVKSLVLIWLTTIAVPAFSGDFYTSKDNLERMYVSKNNHYDFEEKPEEYRYVYIQQNYVIPDVKAGDSEKNEKQPKALIEKKSEKEDKLPRLKRLYVGVYAGYFYTTDNMKFEESKNCSGAYKSEFFCVDEKSNPMDIEYKDDYFLSAVFGINSANMLRLEFSYFKLGNPIEMEGFNQVNNLTQKYLSNIDLAGGSINVYFDFVGDRRQPYLMFIPYVMAGIGASQITLDDIKFTNASKSYTITGKEQRNKTVILGAGFTAGLNNYISLDIGYRHYDFGDVKTDVGMNDGSSNFDVQLKSKLDAHVATVGLKFQI